MHAPVARIRDGRVLSFCSVSCANGTPAPKAAAKEPVKAKSRAVTKAKSARAKDKEASSGVEAAISTPRARQSTPEPVLLEPAPLTMGGARRKRKVSVLVVASVIMLGGMAIAIIQAVSPSSPSDVVASEDAVTKKTAQEQSGESSAAGAPSEDVVIDAAGLRKASITVLNELSTSESERVARLAAMGLARIKDPDALAKLSELLKSEESDLLKIKIATALARAGDDAGRAALVESLNARRRDVRIDAARELVGLGDDSGSAALHQMMSVRSHRIGAAGLLARLGDEKGLALLRSEISSRSSSQENKMRAAVALGRAGDDSVRDQLKAILDDRRYNVGAADALATLGDASSIEALERQLSLSAMRVSAASALRRLNAEVDLGALATLLTTGDEVSRVTAAESLLILTGDDDGGGAERD